MLFRLLSALSARKTRCGRTSAWQAALRVGGGLASKATGQALLDQKRTGTCRRSRIWAQTTDSSRAPHSPLWSSALARCLPANPQDFSQERIWHRKDHCHVSSIIQVFLWWGKKIQQRKASGHHEITPSGWPQLNQWYFPQS